MKWLEKLLGNPAQPREPVEDPVLGRIAWEPAGELWVSPPHGSRSFAIALIGEAAPDARLLPFARELHTEALAFQRTVSLALESEASRTPKIADIIRSLQLESVDLSCPERPRDGMVYFHCEEPAPVWRFDLIDGCPVNLGCDT